MGVASQVFKNNLKTHYDWPITTTTKKLKL
jgi:hypothetical protein